MANQAIEHYKSFLQMDNLGDHRIRFARQRIQLLGRAKKHDDKPSVFIPNKMPGKVGTKPTTKQPEAPNKFAVALYNRALDRDKQGNAKEAIAAYQEFLRQASPGDQRIPIAIRE